MGHRMHGNRRVRSRGAGWEYVHLAIDDATRIAFVEVLPKQCGDATADFLARVTWFARYGIQIRRVMRQRHRLRLPRLSTGLSGVRGPPSADAAYIPRTNTEAERFIQTLLGEWAYARACRTSAQR